MPRSSYEIKRRNTQIITSKIHKLVDEFTGTLEDMCDDPDNFLMTLGVRENLLSDSEMDTLRDILVSMRIKVKETMRSHLINKIKKNDGMLNAICSRMEPVETADEVSERDTMLRKERLIDTNPMATLLRSNLKKDDTCQVPVVLLAAVLIIGDCDEIAQLRDKEQREHKDFPTFLTVMRDGIAYLNSDVSMPNAESTGAEAGPMTEEQLYSIHWKSKAAIHKAAKLLGFTTSTTGSGMIYGYRWTGVGASSINMTRA